MSDLMYVLDTETTGLAGYPNDHVVDIAVCEVNFDAGTVLPVYSSVVGHDVSKWDRFQRKAWIFENTDMTLDMVRSAPSAETVAGEVRELLCGKRVTSYNLDFDMKRFLYHEPWSLRNVINEARCVMLASVNVCKVPGTYGYKWPKLQEAYDLMTVNDPADLRGIQKHRALSDAVAASYVLLELRKRGAY